MPEEAIYQNMKYLLLLGQHQNLGTEYMEGRSKKIKNFENKTCSTEDRYPIVQEIGTNRDETEKR